MRSEWVLLLCRIFWAEHRGAFASIPGFTFEGDHTVSPQCSFVFKSEEEQQQPGQDG
jgi:hypothetical protein